MFRPSFVRLLWLTFEKQLQQAHCIAFWTGCKIFTLSPYNHGTGGKSIKSICWGVLKRVHLKKKKSPEAPSWKGSAIIHSSTSSFHPFIFNPRLFIDPPFAVDQNHHATIHLNMPVTSPSQVIVGRIYMTMCWNEEFKHVPDSDLVRDLGRNSLFWINTVSVWDYVWGFCAELQRAWCHFTGFQRSFFKCFRNVNMQWWSKFENNL